MGTRYRFEGRNGTSSRSDVVDSHTAVCLSREPVVKEEPIVSPCKTV